MSNFRSAMISLQMYFYVKCMNILSISLQPDIVPYKDVWSRTFTVTFFIFMCFTNWLLLFIDRNSKKYISNTNKYSANCILVKSI